MYSWSRLAAKKPRVPAKHVIWSMPNKAMLNQSTLRPVLQPAHVVFQLLQALQAHLSVWNRLEEYCGLRSLPHAS